MGTVENYQQNQLVNILISKNQAKVNCRGKSPMHIIVWISLIGHAMHKTTLLILLL